VSALPIRAAAAFVLGAVVLPAAAVLAAGAWTPGYGPGPETVSRLASDGQPWAWLVRTGLVAGGVLLVAGARALAGRGRPVAALARVSGTATVVAGLVPKDPVGVPASTLSTLHVGAAVTGVVALVVAMALVALRGSERAERLVAAAAGAVTVGAGAAFPFLWGSAVYGVVERVVLAVPACWLVTLVRPAAAGQAGSQR
jgi:hypothetical protein